MSQMIEENTKPVTKRGFHPHEKVAVDAFKRKRTIYTSLFRINEVSGENQIETALNKELDKDDASDLFDAQIYGATGASDSTVGMHLLSNLALAVIPSKSDSKGMAERINSIARSMHALEPQDSYEGQLAAQLVVLHEQAMEWLGRANRTDRSDFANIYLNGASKLLTRHHETLEALLKYRRRGEQRVHVEHVHVHGGGKAIVGNITPGCGLTQKFEEGPHAKV
jgi:hypothetical protein